MDVVAAEPVLDITPNEDSPVRGKNRTPNFRVAEDVGVLADLPSRLGQCVDLSVGNPVGTVSHMIHSPAEALPTLVSIADAPPVHALGRELFG